MDKKDIYYYAKYGNVALSFGLNLVGSIGLLAWGGYFLDKRLHTTPVLMITGILLGVVLAFRGLYELMKGMEQHDLMEHEAKNPVYQRAMNLRRLYFKKARIKRNGRQKGPKE